MQSDRLSQCSSSSSLKQLSIDGFTVNRGSLSNARDSRVRQSLFTPIVPRILPEDSDVDDDDLSDFTSVTNRCPVDSTTETHTDERNNHHSEKSKSSEYYMNLL